MNYIKIDMNYKKDKISLQAASKPINAGTVTKRCNVNTFSG